MFVPFFLLGLLVGNIAGLSQAAVTLPLVAALFAFVGGSAVAFVKDLKAAQLNASGRAVAALSLGCLIGLYAGILVREHRLLSPSQAGAPRVASSPSDTSHKTVSEVGYLRSGLLHDADRIDALRQSNAITPAQAFDSLYNAIRVSP